MRIPTLLLAILALSAAEARTQVTPPRAASPRAVPATAPAQRPGCILVASSELRMPFAGCPTPGPTAGAARTVEVEVVEYRNGDAPTSVAVQVRGTPRDDLEVISVDWVDPDDDGDGLPTTLERSQGGAVGAPAARRIGGRTKVGRVTLRRDAAIAGGPGSNWPTDMDGDGFPMRITLSGPAGGAEHMHLDRCAPEAPGGRGPSAASRGTITLACESVRVESDAGSSPYARWVAAMTLDRERARGAGGTDLREEPTPVPPSASARVGRLAEHDADAAPRARTLRQVQLTGWSVTFSRTAAGASVSSWTLEVRVQRIEMAD